MWLSIKISLSIILPYTIYNIFKFSFVFPLRSSLSFYEGTDTTVSRNMYNSSKQGIHFHNNSSAIYNNGFRRERLSYLHKSCSQLSISLSCTIFLCLSGGIKGAGNCVTRSPSPVWYPRFLSYNDIRVVSRPSSTFIPDAEDELSQNANESQCYSIAL